MVVERLLKGRVGTVRRTAFSPSSMHERSGTVASFAGGKDDEGDRQNQYPPGLKHREGNTLKEMFCRHDPSETYSDAMFS